MEVRPTPAPVWRVVGVLPVVLLLVVTGSLQAAAAPDAASPEAPPPDAARPGPDVADLQQALTALSLYRGPIDGVYGRMTAQAVMAFHKHMGLERSFEWEPDDWRYLSRFRLPQPLEEDQVVVDLDRQLLYLHQRGSVAVIPVSSGNGERYRGRGGRLVTARTPEGEFTFTRHVDGLRVSYLGELWRPWYFRGGYAIHGSGSVPGHPASHGCIRVPNWEADWLAGRLALGMKVTVGRGGPVEPPVLDEPGPSPLRRTEGGLVDRSGRRVA